MRIWRREAPIVRSVANSRIRCAIVIESEFAITNAPTKSAIPPNASRNPWRNAMNSFVSDASSSACWRPVTACAFDGRIALDLLEELLRRDPGLRRDRDLVEPALLLEQRCAVGRSKPARVAPPMVRANSTIPEMRSCSHRPLDLDADLVADLEVLLLRGPESITTWSVLGHCPRRVAAGSRSSRRRRSRSRGSVRRRTRSPCCPSRSATSSRCRRFLPPARPPASPRTSPRSDSVSVGSVTPLPSVRSNADLPETRRSSPGGRP